VIKKSNFFQQVYEVVMKIPLGKVATYGQIAEVLGIKDARKVGFALHANKNTSVPCHRVVNKEGKLASGYAFGGQKEQRLRLLGEGVIFTNEGYINLSKCLWNIF
jgi:methylated-DNA-protein-cysteine methyltransferase related protein